MAAVLVLFSSQRLPDIVASHFDSAGRPNGSMPRATYVGCMLLFTVGLPLLVVFSSRRALRNPHARINVPHAQFWLGHERRASTVGYIMDAMAVFGSLLVTFLAYVNWLVVRANAESPPLLPSAWFLCGLGAFFLATLVWIVRLVGHFRAIPP
ncbi:MAG TPA: DUF1648 domain-containing protein [Steroidobacteraceae bacterium]|nr:DUF1648 domain-containing protein [Steroidobacteraceae bacterium]